MGAPTKRIFGAVTLVALLTAAVVLALDGVAAGQSGWEGWEKFTHPRYGFSIRYPADWETESGTGLLTFLAQGPHARAGDFIYRMNVAIGFEKVPAEMTSEEYEAANEETMGLVFPGYRRLRTDRTTVGKLPAVLRYYTWRRNDGLELYQMQLYVVKNGRGWVVSGTTTTQSAQLQQEAALLQRIIQTFRP